MVFMVNIGCNVLDRAQLTEFQKACNAKIKSCHQAIEWGYGDNNNIFQLSANPKNLQLGKKNPYLSKQVRVCHLLTNIYVCCNGVKSSGYQMFQCPLPTLWSYLTL